jgi:nitroreductase
MDSPKGIISKIIRDRRSTWPVSFNPDIKIDNTIIMEILDTAVWAPSHGLTQPWHFTVFHGEGIRTFFHKQKEIYQATNPPDSIKENKLLKYEEKIKQVSHVIAISMKRDPNRKYPEIEEIVAVGCVIENIYLCLEAYGIAGYLSTGNVCYTRQMKDFLHLGDEDHCLGFFQLGYPKTGINRAVRKRIPATEKTVWISE